MATAFDTLTAAEELQAGGFDADQSKLIAQLLQQAIVGKAATKEDFERLENSIERSLENFLAAIKREIR